MLALANFFVNTFPLVSGNHLQFFVYFAHIKATKSMIDFTGDWLALANILFFLLKRGAINMKIKVLSVIFSAILVLSLTGCGKDDVDSSASDTGSNTTEAADNATDSTSVSGTFVKMNIPYGDFFANEFEGGEGVDAVSSATMNKAANDKLTGGTYHLKDNSKILGVSFPVCIPEGTEIDDSLKVNDEASLYDAADYSYVELAEIPKNYKELSKDSSGKYSFSKTIGDAEDLSLSEASIPDERILRYSSYPATAPKQYPRII